LVNIPDRKTGKAPLKNAIQEMIKNELGLDHHYIP
jgi:hypothetical protein